MQNSSAELGSDFKNPKSCESVNLQIKSIQYMDFPLLDTLISSILS